MSQWHMIWSGKAAQLSCQYLSRVFNVIGRATVRAESDMEWAQSQFAGRAHSQVRCSERKKSARSIHSTVSATSANEDHERRRTPSDVNHAITRPSQYANTSQQIRQADIVSRQQSSRRTYRQGHKRALCLISVRNKPETCMFLHIPALFPHTSRPLSCSLCPVGERIVRYQQLSA